MTVSQLSVPARDEMARHLFGVGLVLLAVSGMAAMIGSGLSWNDGVWEFPMIPGVILMCRAQWMHATRGRNWTMFICVLIATWGVGSIPDYLAKTGYGSPLLIGSACVFALMLFLLRGVVDVVMRTPSTESERSARLH